jgi:hypothetical protein
MATSKTFISDSGTKITTSDKAEIKRLRACGWQEVKPTKQVYAKGLESGNSFLK